MAPIALEFCCGSARLSLSLDAVGFKAIGFDHAYNKCVPEAFCLSIDLTTHKGRCLGWAWLKHPRTKFTWYAPPCGTATRARERPGGPPPLRSDFYPEGFPNLTGRHKVRVEAANAIYAFTALAAAFCDKMGIFFVIENPLRSLMWLLQAMQNLLLFEDVLDIDYHACMHGGLRQKAQKLRSNMKQLKSLSIWCDRSHDHAPWISWANGHKVFHTGEEAHYPREFCQKVSVIAASVIMPKALSYEVSVKAIQLKSKLAEQRRANAAATSRQARVASAALVAEYKRVVTAEGPTWMHHLLHKWLAFGSKPHNIMPDIPADAKILEVRPKDWGKEEQDAQEQDGRRHEQNAQEQHGRKQRYTSLLHANKDVLLKIGVPWDCREFVSLAMATPHPFMASAVATNPDALQSIFNILTLGAEAITNKRMKFVALLEQWILELEEMDSEIKKNMNEGVLRIMRNKKVAVMKRLMDLTGHNDPFLIRDMVGGFKMVGPLDECPAFPAVVPPQAADIEKLMLASKWAQHAVVGFLRRRGEDDGALTACMKEVTETKTMTGPFTQKQVKEKLGPLFVPMPRFCIDQGGKIRAIDHASLYGQNSTISVPWKLVLGGVDEVAALAATWLKAVKDDRSVTVKLPGGTTLRGRLHESFSLEEARTLVGKLADMEGAFKQLAAFPGHAFARVVAVWDHGKQEVVFFLPDALMFGEAAAVYGFNRTSKFLTVVATRCADLVVSSYYDDFSQLELEKLSASADSTFKAIFKKLGFALSEDPAKDKQFSKKFSPLGVEIDLSKSGEGLVSISPKVGRVVKIVEHCKTIVKDGKLTFKDARTLQGVLRFLRESLFGRCGGMLLHSLQQHQGSSGSVSVSKTLEEELLWLICYLPVASPRLIKVCELESVVHLFCDGACEPERVTVGGCLFEAGRRPEAFGSEVPLPVVRRWTAGVKHQVIGQAEIAPVTISTRLWSERLRGRFCICWIDQDAARQAVIKGYSPVRESAGLVEEISLRLASLGAFVWYARVPSASNPADHPSRLDWKKFFSFFPDARRVAVPSAAWLAC